MTNKNDLEASHLELRLARAYIPSQRYTERYKARKGLNQGTIFPELDLPYQNN